MTRGERGTLTLYDASSVHDSLVMYHLRGCKTTVTKRKGRWDIKVDCPHPVPPQIRAYLKRLRLMKNGHD